MKQILIAAVTIWLAGCAVDTQGTGSEIELGYEVGGSAVASGTGGYQTTESAGGSAAGGAKQSTGGAPSTGGTVATGGTLVVSQLTGGSTQSASTGGSATGGLFATGGRATGGFNSTGGLATTGGKATTGGTATGGAATGGRSTGGAGAGGSSAADCAGRNYQGAICEYYNDPTNSAVCLVRLSPMASAVCSYNASLVCRPDATDFDSACYNACRACQPGYESTASGLAACNAAIAASNTAAGRPSGGSCKWAA